MAYDLLQNLRQMTSNFGQNASNIPTVRNMVYQMNAANAEQNPAPQQPATQTTTPQQTNMPQFRGFNQPAQQQQQAQQSLGSGQGLYDYLSKRSAGMSAPEYEQSNLMLQAMGMPGLPERQVNPIYEFLLPLVNRTSISENIGFSKYL